MKFEKLGDDIYLPERSDKALKNSKIVKFNYYVSTRNNAKLLDLDITTKLFDHDEKYIRKSCYRIKAHEIEECVKANLRDHMTSLGLKMENIPRNLKNSNTANRRSRLSNTEA
jgi:hypothetical protein